LIRSTAFIPRCWGSRRPARELKWNVLSWINLKAPDSDDYVELMLAKTAPAENARGGAHHLCLVVPDVPEAVVKLKATAYMKSTRARSRCIWARTGSVRRICLTRMARGRRLWSRGPLMEWRRRRQALLRPDNRMRWGRRSREVRTCRTASRLRARKGRENGHGASYFPPSRDETPGSGAPSVVRWETS